MTNLHFNHRESVKATRFWAKIDKIGKKWDKYATFYSLFLEFGRVGFNDAFNTIRLYKRQGCLQTAVLSGNHKTKSAVLFRLLTQTKEAPKKRTVRVTNT